MKSIKKIVEWLSSEPVKSKPTVDKSPSVVIHPIYSEKQLKEKYGNLSIEEVLLDDKIDGFTKKEILLKLQNYSIEEANELIETAKREARKARLNKIKAKISRKAQELYGGIPSDDEREPISDEVKLFVWQRDSGKCVKCGSKERLEFDHIIPLSKGGSNTERNIQLLCEKCNREKSDNIG